MQRAAWEALDQAGEGERLLVPARSAVLVVALSLLATATPADTDDPWESDSKKMTCSQTAWPLTVLGVVGLVVILALRGAVISHNEIYYRNPWWRLLWWASGLSCWSVSVSSDISSWFR
jgi:hypothetical protein